MISIYKNNIRLSLAALLCAAVTALSSCGTAIDESSASAVSAVSTTAAETTTADVTTTVSEAVTTAETEATSDTTAASETITETVTTEETTAAAESEAEPELPYCSAAGVWCVDDGRVIYSLNADDTISLASITKLLTASVMLKYLESDTVVTVGTEIMMIKPDSTTAFLSIGNELTVGELVSAMLLPSGNDAAYTAAVSTARAIYAGTEMTDRQAVDIFVGLMNEFAAELGMNSSHFANPEGWDDPYHYTTLNDLMKLVNYALTVPEIQQSAAAQQLTVYFRSGGYAAWTNTNKLLDPNGEYYSPDCIGLKTGTTLAAGSCLAAAFYRGGKTYVCAVMGCGDDQSRYSAALALSELF